MEHCTNCDKDLPEHKFDLHLGYCRRNIKRCTDCNLPYDTNQEEQHRQQYHNMVACKYCTINFKPNAVKDHQENCQSKPIICNYCDLAIPKQILEGHIIQCESRTQICEKCSKSIMKKQYQQHYVGCFGPIQNEIESASNQNMSSDMSYYSQSYHNSSSSYSASSSISSQYRPNMKKQAVGEPRVVSRRIISGPRAGEILPVGNQGEQKVERQKYTDPKTGATSIRTVTTRTYIKYQDSNPAPAQKIQTSYNHTSTSYNPANNSLYSQGFGMDGQDPQMQAALYASLGFQDEKLYKQIQKQTQLQKQLQKK